MLPLLKTEEEEEEGKEGEEGENVDVVGNVKYWSVPYRGLPYLVLVGQSLVDSFQAWKSLLSAAFQHSFIKL